LSIAGIVLLFAVKREYWTGIAIGALLMSMAGHIEETISKNFNEQYYEAVIAEAKNIDQNMQ
jgi:uncharacterized membrane protein YkvI